MVRAIDPQAPFEFVLEEDREAPEEDRTVFLLRVLTTRELQEIEDNLAGFNPDTGEAKVLHGSSKIKILKAGLAGWRNFRDHNGAEVEFKTEAVGSHRRGRREYVKDELLDRLHPDWRSELAEAITQQTRLKEDDVKNS